MSVLWLLPAVALIGALAYGVARLYLRPKEMARDYAGEISRLQATIEALALAIDAKDQTAENHLLRVQTYSGRLAEVLGMSPPEVHAVRTAALLHDIGKLAVPEHILSKPGPLTPEEFQKVRIHPKIGADIIGAVPFAYPVAPLILSHHERWDGRGYPAGLRGSDIPLGARILTVVDYFDALTSDRPYHKAMNEDAALGLLQQESGKALDPQIVATFLRVLPELRAAAAHAGPAPVNVSPADALTETVLPAPGPDGAKSVFDDIALAHREIYALYEIAQTMGTSLGVADTMSLISSKLANLVPFSACALFLCDDAETLCCRFATGEDAQVIQRLRIKSGAGLTGWVARNRRPLVNARPASDFEAGGVDHQTPLQSALVCPLVFNDRLIGTLAVYHTDTSFYRDDHRRLIDRVCEQAAAVVHNSIVFEQTREDALTDPLTALPNTRFMFVHLARELARAERLKSEVAMLVLDLDDFKDINDHHGHHVGDRALREVARVLRTAIRPYDICVRYAGDEFIVVLAGCGREEAERKRVELQQAVNRVVFEAVPGREVALAISAGAAVFPHDGATYETLLAQADTRMYADKGQRKLDAGGPASVADDSAYPAAARAARN